MGFSERNLANLATASAPFAEYLQATTGWPASILMGSSPGGLGKEGRFEERVWSELVDQWQTVYCSEPVEQIFEYMLLSKEGPTGGKIPESWELVFPSTFSESPQEKATLRSTQAQTDSTEIASGVITPLEVRMNRHGGVEYSTETVLDDDVTSQMEMKAESTFQAEMTSIDAQMNQLQGLDPQGNPLPDPNAPPPDGAPPGAEGGAAPGAESQQSQSETPPSSGAPKAAKAAKPAAPAKAAKPKAKTDSLDPPSAPGTLRYDALGLEIAVLRTDSVYTLGTTSGGQPVPVVLGPNRKRSHAIYRASLSSPEGASHSDSEFETKNVYITGFPTLSAARTGFAKFFPEYRMAPMTVVPFIPGGPS
jgi:hypothetical protein